MCAECKTYRGAGQTNSPHGLLCTLRMVEVRDLDRVAAKPEVARDTRCDVFRPVSTLQDGYQQNISVVLATLACLQLISVGVFIEESTF